MDGHLEVYFGPLLANTLSYQTLLWILIGIYGMSFIAVKTFVKQDIHNKVKG